MVLVLAASMASYAFWHRYQSTRLTLEYWGSKTAHNILYGDIVELLVLRSEASDNYPYSTTPPELDHLITETIDLSQARGLVHLRTALVEDRSFNWECSFKNPCTPNWRYALRFREPTKDTSSTTVLFLELDCERMIPLGQSEPISIKPISESLKHFIQSNSNGSIL